MIPRTVLWTGWMLLAAARPGAGAEALVGPFETAA
jgi:hypothetical protein